LTRVLFLAESFHPVLGGGERHVRQLGGTLAASGARVTVVTRRSEAALAADERFEGMRVVRVPPPGPGRTGKFRMLPAALAALVRLRGEFDVLVVRGTRVLGLPGLVAGRALGRAVVLQPEVNGELSGEVYTWGTRRGQGLTGAALGAAVRLRNGLLRDADAWVAMSRAIRDEMLCHGVPPERVALIPHGVDTRHFRPASAGERRALRAGLGLPADAVVLAFTGRLLRGKGLESLVEAFGRLAAERDELHLLLVGSGAGQALSVEDALRRQVAEAGLGRRVTFSGRVDDVERWLRAANVFVFPSEFEALGLSLLEAAACGLPAVGARTGGIVDVIEDGVSGALFAPGDVAGLAASLRRVTEAGEAGRAALGAAARRRVEASFDADAALERYRGLFRELSRPTTSFPPAGAPRAGAAPPRSSASPA
jgi:glycosyltransferase involved in cell wall biosynthesis